jgi:hypothetical protein
VFTFKNCVTSLGRTPSGECSEEVFHPVGRFSLVATNGMLLILNGINVNRKILDLYGYDDSADSAVSMLQMRPPYEPLSPLISTPGNGRIFGRGYKWRYRWKDSRSGECSGLSPSPTFKWNLGVETPTGTQRYLGQQVYFNIPNAAPFNADTLQLFRNSSQEEGIWYLVAEARATGSYIYLRDDFPDDEIFTKETAGLTPNPTWDEGLMPPVAKAYVHPTGRIWYYGLIRMGVHGRRGATSGSLQPTSANAVLNPDNEWIITTANPVDTQNCINPARMGQRITATRGNVGGNVTGPGTGFRIVQVYQTGSGVFSYRVRLTPTLDLNAPPFDAADSQTAYIIEDDRDARSLYMSEPAKPTQIDPLKTVFIGEDFDDNLYHLFSLGGVTYAQTSRRIYRITNDFTLDPSLSMEVMAASEEGTVGLWSGCWTPFGWVYLHETLGVRLFDGQMSRPLGSQSVLDDFIARTQVDRIQLACKNETLLSYDEPNHKVVVSYIPSGRSHFTETLVYDPLTDTWRGPYRETVYSSGVVRAPGGDETTLFGDEHGNLFSREEQALDLVQAASGVTTSGSVTSTSTSVNGRFLTASAATFTGGGERVRGCPIWVTRSGTYYYSVISDVVDINNLELLHKLVDVDGNETVPTSGDTFQIGAIHWSLETTYIHADEPIQPKKWGRLRMGFRRAAAGGGYTVAVSLDDSGTFVGEQLESGSEAAASVTPTNEVYAEARLMRTAKAFTLRLRGLATGTSTTVGSDPKITSAIADVIVMAGA